MSHLLAVIYLARTTSGYLFPSPAEKERLCKEDCVDFTAHHHVDYQLYERNISAICKRLLTRDGPFNTHLGRKTYYLFAYWGGGEEMEIQKSARHAVNSTSAIQYSKDAKYLLEIAIENGWSMDNVTKWRPILCTNLQLGRQLNFTGAQRFQTLDLLSIRFFEGYDFHLIMLGYVVLPGKILPSVSTT